MTRKMLTATMLVAALLLSVLSFGGLTDSAEAQGKPTCPYFNSVVLEEGDFGYIDCADAIAYTGPFTNMPDGPTGPYGWGSLNIVAGDGAAAGGDAGGTGGGLAHTGSESAVLGYVGAGLIAFGAVTLGSRRKFFQGALD